MKYLVAPGRTAKGNEFHKARFPRFKLECTGNCLLPLSNRHRMQIRVLLDQTRNGRERQHGEVAGVVKQ